MRSLLATCLAIFLVSILLTTANAVTVHQWSNRFGANLLDAGMGVAIDGDGNVILLGLAYGDDFGGGSVNGPTVLAKFDPNGVYLWSKDIDVEAYAVAVDGDGDIVVTGWCYDFDTVDFGGGPLPAEGYEDMFLVKFSADGVHQWSQRHGEPGWQTHAYSICVDGSGDVIVTGAFGGTVSFGGEPLVSAGQLDIFLARYDEDGVHEWSQRIGGTGAELEPHIALDGSSNVILGASFQGSFWLGSTLMTSYGSLDILAVKYGPNGLLQWKKHFGNATVDAFADIAADASGNVFLMGHCRAPVDFGGGTLNFDSPSSGTALVKLDPNGAHVWSLGFNGTSGVRGHAMDVNAGSVVLTGLFGGTIDFGGGPLTRPSADIFAVMFDSDGTHQWSRQFGGTGAQEWGSGVAVDASGSFVLTGKFEDTTDFGGGPLTSAGGSDVFLAKFGDAPVPVLITQFSAASRGGGVEVAWNFSTDEPLDAFSLLRRAEGSSKFVAIAAGDPTMTRSYVDESVDAGRSYAYQLVITTEAGSTFQSPIVTVDMPKIGTVLGPCYPNPFNPTTTIDYTLAEPMRVTIEIVDPAGAIVARLDQGARPVGTHHAQWQGRDVAGRTVSSGVYFYRLAGVPNAGTGKMTLLK